METPDVTKNDLLGVGALVGVLVTTSTSDDPTVVLASIIAATAIALTLVIADTIRRTSRARHLKCSRSCPNRKPASGA